MKYKFITLLMLMSFFSINSFAQKRIKKVKMSLTKTTFYIRNVASGKELDLPGLNSDAKTSNGTNVVLWDHDSGADRKFKFQSAGNKYYYLLPQHCKSRLDIEGCYKGKRFCKFYKHKNGAPIQIWKFDGKSAPDVGKWKLEQVKKGQFHIVNKYSGKVLDASSQNVNKNGCKVMIWSKNNGKNQLWELINTKTGQRYEL